MKYIFSLLLIVFLTSCEKINVITITATGNNGDGTVNIEYRTNGRYKDLSHVSVDSLLNFIREKPLAD